MQAVRTCSTYTSNVLSEIFKKIFITELNLFNLDNNNVYIICYYTQYIYGVFNSLTTNVDIWIPTALRRRRFVFLAVLLNIFFLLHGWTMLLRKILINYNRRYDINKHYFCLYNLSFIRSFIQYVQQQQNYGWTLWTNATYHSTLITAAKRLVFINNFTDPNRVLKWMKTINSRELKKEIIKWWRHAQHNLY